RKPLLDQRRGGIAHQDDGVDAGACEAAPDIRMYFPAALAHLDQSGSDVYAAPRQVSEESDRSRGAIRIPVVAVVDQGRAVRAFLRFHAMRKRFRLPDAPFCLV